MTEYKNINSLWSLADWLTVEQAAALIVGYDPNKVYFNKSEGDIYYADESGVAVVDCSCSIQTALIVLKNAINAGKLKVKIVHDSRPVNPSDFHTLIDMMECGEYYDPGYESIAGNDEHHCNGYFVKNNPSWNKTYVAVDELRAILSSKGQCSGFFFKDLTNSTNAADYLKPKHPRYSPKLAAAIYAWEEMEDENKLRGKNPCSAMIIYLTSNYLELGLFHEKDNLKNGTKAGDINKTAISEVAKIANWQPGGGAPKTPSR